MAKKPKKKSAKKTHKINWDEVEQLYVYGELDEGPPRIDPENPKPDDACKIAREFPTTTQLAARFSVSEGTLRTRCAAGGWVKKRNKFRTELRQETRDKMLTKLSDQGASFRLKSFEIANMSVAGIHEKMRQAHEQGCPLSIDDLDAYSRILRNFQAAGMAALGAGEEEAISGEDYETIIEELERERRERTQEVDQGDKQQPSDLYQSIPVDTP